MHFKCMLIYDLIKVIKMELFYKNARTKELEEFTKIHANIGKGITVSGERMTSWTSLAPSDSILQ